MKKITVNLTDKAESAFNEIMYSLPKHPDGTGMCTQSQAISYALECVQAFELIMNQDIISFLNEVTVERSEIEP